MLSTLFPLPVHLEDQHSEFLKSWMAYLDFEEFPNIIKYYTTIGNGTLLKEEYTTIKECTLLMDIKHFTYPTIFLRQHSQPNPTNIEYTTIVVETFYTTIGQYPTLYDFLAITPKDITCLNYYQTYPNKFARLKIFQPTLLLCTLGRCHITCVT